MRRPFIAGVLVAVLAGVLMFKCTDTVSARKTLAISVAADSTVLVNDTLQIRASAQGANAVGIRYVWFFTNAAAPDTSADSIFRQVFTIADTGKRCIVVKAVDQAGTVSAPDSLHVHVRWLRPSAVLHAVTPIAVSDTELCIAVAVDSCGAIQTYQWMIDSFPFMTKSDSVRWLFNDKADAWHTVRLAVVDNNGFVSDTDTVQIHVMLHRPAVTVTPHDTAVYSYTNLKLRASGSDSNGTVARYSWMLDGRAEPITSDSLTVTFDAGSAGTHFLTVTAIDTDSLASPPDSAIITVLPGGPTITPLHDTTMSNLDTLHLACQASDSSGTIVKYLWQLSGGTGWSDSTTGATHILTYTGTTPLRVIVGARDNHGLVGTDTFTVNFNLGPASLAVTIPQPVDTVMLPQGTPACSLTFAYAAVGSNLGAITYSLSWGTNPDSLTAVYQGPNQNATIGGIGPGSYAWKVVALDTYGHAVANTGTVTVLRQYLIGFVGHSIVAGYGGNNIVGGFRGGVLDSLRAHLGPYERVKSVGPVTPPYMSRSVVDDSCLGIVQATGSAVYNAMTQIVPLMTADIWVLMTGVNDNYDPEGLTYAVALIDLMHGRNPNSRIYVLNGLPRPPTDNSGGNSWLPSFNQGLADTVQLRQSTGTNAFLVNADSAMSDSGGVYDSVYYCDGLHPDQPGYDRLARAIYSVMKVSSPPVVP